MRHEHFDQWQRTEAALGVPSLRRAGVHRNRARGAKNCIQFSVRTGRLIEVTDVALADVLEHRMDPMTARLFGALVHKLRNEFGLNLEDLAAGCNRSEKWVDRVQYGEEQIDATAVREIAGAFRRCGCDADVVAAAAEIVADPLGPLGSYLATKVPTQVQRRERSQFWDHVSELRIRFLVRAIILLLALIAGILIYRIVSLELDPITTILS